MKNLIVLLFLLTGSVFANENVYTYSFGDFKVSLLSEGQRDGNKSILIGVTPEMLSKYAPNGTFPSSINAFLIKTGKQNILVDTGLGKNLLSNLKSLGVSPEKIDILLITHMHGDHIGGMVSGGKKVFPKAKIYIAKPEHDYWTKDEQRLQAVSAAITPYKNSIILFDPENLNSSKELINGIKAIASYGHTPGHTSFLLESKGEKLMIWGDLTHAMAIQMPYPQISVTYDVDPKLAAETRLKMLKFVCDKNIPVAGMHIAYPSIGKIKSNGAGGYTFNKI